MPELETLKSRKLSFPYNLQKESMNKKIAVFADFDGTITLEDIGDELFKDFGAFEPHHTRLREGKLEIKDYWRKVFDTLPLDLTLEKVADYALKFQTDPYFPTFAKFCRERSIPLTVVSDGFDAYIDPILESLGLGYLPTKRNNFVITTNGLKPRFPGASESCECMCASCKRNAVINSAENGTIIVYIGDGYSDYCAAEHADVIFAKKALAAYCNENRLPHYPFSSFFDVKRLLEKSIDEGKIRIRRQAELKRYKAFEVE